MVPDRRLPPEVHREIAVTLARAGLTDSTLALRPFGGPDGGPGDGLRDGPREGGPARSLLPRRTSARRASR